MNEVSRTIFIFANDTLFSQETAALLKEKLEASGFKVSPAYTEDAELIFCIGGDGAFLETVHKFRFPSMPIVGINTGHLGFFQELHPSQIDEFISNYLDGRFSIQPLSTVKATVDSGTENQTLRGLNEIVIRAGSACSIHLDISIGGSMIERFSGDGILVATPAGSTAYNYSLGGSIVDPRLSLIQVTPIAPINTTAYRSFTSSILLPADLSLGVVPEPNQSGGIEILVDGRVYRYREADRITVSLSRRDVRLLRFDTYDFWEKVKSKFL